MSKMVRKQICVYRRQDALIKGLAKLRGISQAEIIRQAIDHETVQASLDVTDLNHSAWEEILKSVEERLQMDKTGGPLRWNRQEIYAERENRLYPDPTQKEE